MCTPLGWITVMDELLVVADALVDGITCDLEAAVSIKAVVDKSGGLEQLGSCGNAICYFYVQQVHWSKLPSGWCWPTLVVGTATFCVSADGKGVVSTPLMGVQCAGQGWLLVLAGAAGVAGMIGAVGKQRCAMAAFASASAFARHSFAATSLPAVLLL